MLILNSNMNQLKNKPIIVKSNPKLPSRKNTNKKVLTKENELFLQSLYNKGKGFKKI